MHYILAGIILGVFGSFFFLYWVAKDEELASSTAMGYLKHAHMKSVFVALVSAVFGVVFWMNHRAGLHPSYFFDALSVLLLLTALYDVLFRLIPSSLIIGLIWVIFLASLFLGVPLPITSSAVGAVVVGGVVFLLYGITKGKGIGEADIFLAGVIGALFGWQYGLLVFSAANFLGLLTIIPLMMIFGKERLRQIPLVFFIVLAIFLEWYAHYGDAILTSLRLI